MSQPRCAYCGREFEPRPNVRRVQKACGRTECRRERKREADRGWRRKNRGWFEGRRGKVRQWAAGYPDYWQKWRREHPGYRERERARMRLKRGRVAKQDAIRRDPVGYLEGVRALGRVAKQDEWILLDGLVDYLEAYAVAKPNAMEAGRPGG